MIAGSGVPSRARFSRARFESSAVFDCIGLCENTRQLTASTDKAAVAECLFDRSVQLAEHSRILSVGLRRSSSRAPLLLHFFNAHDVFTADSVFDQFRHAPATVVVLDRCHDRLALSLGPGAALDIRQIAFRNIHLGFMITIVARGIRQATLEF